MLDPPGDWRVADAEPTWAQLTQCFSDITIALNSDARLFVEACEMTRPGLNRRPTGQSSDIMACLDQLLEGSSTRIWYASAPQMPAGFLSVLRHLETKGLSRGITGGLASVRHSR